MSATPSHPAGEPGLVRRLTTTDAVVVGLAAMIGAGIFAAPAPAAAAAGSALLLSVLLAAVLAYANATSTAQLAAAHPVAGGAYAYGRRYLGDWPGYAAGWCFVVGKAGSCAAMALAFASYAAPGQAKLAAALAVAAVVAVTTRGITRTARVARVLVTLTLAVLLLVVVVAAWHGLGAGGAGGGGGGDAGAGGAQTASPTWYGVAQAASIMFFAFAGYARVATLGEEVIDPARAIPRAVQIALGVVVAVYLAVCAAALATLGPAGLARSTAPLADVVTAAGVPDLGWVVRAGAAAACLGALVGLVPGVGRTSLAMARTGDLPAWVGRIHPVHRVPARAEYALGAVVVAVVLLADVRGAIGFSSFAILLYYAVANASALRQPRADRRWPRALQVLGLAGCLGVAATVPPASLAAGAGVLALGLLLRAPRLRYGRRTRESPSS